MSDQLWIVLFSTVDGGTLTVTMGSAIFTTSAIVTGINRFSMNLASAPGSNVTLSRNGAQVFSFWAPVSYSTDSPSQYNYNVNAAWGPN